MKAQNGERERNAMKSLLRTKEKRVAVSLVNGPDDEEKTIVVLGVQRGGTSMVAGVLRALGVDMGSAGLNHEDNRFLGKSDKDLVEAVRLRNAEAKVWGFKAPEVTMQLDVLEGELRNPVYIGVTRNIAAVVDSWLQRGAKDAPLVMHRALQYYNRMGRLARETDRPYLLVNYERAAANPEEAVMELCRFVRFNPSQEQIAAAVSMITGDGGGYVNVRSEYFHVSVVEAIPGTSCKDLTISTTESGVELLPSSGQFLPEAFSIVLENLGPGEHETLTATFKFGAGYSHLHNQKLLMPAAQFALLIETGGAAKGCQLSGPVIPANSE